jgi:hypothetical protein
MKQIISALLCAALLLMCVSCGKTSAGTATVDAADAITESAQESAEADSTSTQSASSALSNLYTTPDTILVESQDSYDAPYCFRPESDGSYHFCASTADDFQGASVGYGRDILGWTVYVLDEAWEGDWSQLAANCNPSIVDLTSSTDLALKAGQYVYCLCSLNATTGSAAANGAGALSIDRAGDQNLPDTSHSFYRLVDLNAQCSFDLDGDGENEEIYYEVQSNYTSSNGLLLGDQAVSLTVDGTEFLRPTQDNPTDAFGFWLEEPMVGSYAVVDLDTSDPYYELAIGDMGSNGLSLTYFLRYVDGSLVCLGYCSGLLEENTIQLHGDGSLSALTPLNVFQTWSAWCPYQLQQDALKQLTGKFVEPQLAVSRTISLRESVTAYEKPSLDAPQVELTCTGAVTFPLTDGTNWVQVSCADGSTGWLYCTDFSNVWSDGVAVDASTYFSNLFLAG